MSCVYQKPKKKHCQIKHCYNKPGFCSASILEDVAKVSRCEATLFCRVTKRLTKEIKKVRSFKKLCHVIDVGNRFLWASAAKEKSIAEIINACSENKYTRH